MKIYYALIGNDGKRYGHYHGYMPINAGRKIATKILNCSKISELVINIVRYSDGKTYKYYASKMRLPKPKPFSVGSKILYRNNIIHVAPVRG